MGAQPRPTSLGRESYSDHGSRVRIQKDPVQRSPQLTGHRDVRPNGQACGHRCGSGLWGAGGQWGTQGRWLQSWDLETGRQLVGGRGGNALQGRGTAWNVAVEVGVAAATCPEGDNAVIRGATSAGAGRDNGKGRSWGAAGLMWLSPGRSATSTSSGPVGDKAVTQTDSAACVKQSANSGPHNLVSSCSWALHGCY